ALINGWFPPSCGCYDAPHSTWKEVTMISAKLLQLMVDASNDGVVVAEEEGDDNILIYANPAVQRLTGYAPEDSRYRDCRCPQNHDRAQSALPLIREAIRNRQPSRQILRNCRKDGTAFWNELSITPVFDEADKLSYFIGTQTDVAREVET